MIAEIVIAVVAAVLGAATALFADRAREKRRVRVGARRVWFSLGHMMVSMNEAKGGLPGFVPQSAALLQADWDDYGDTLIGGLRADHATQLQNVVTATLSFAKAPNLWPPGKRAQLRQDMEGARMMLGRYRGGRTELGTELPEVVAPKVRQVSVRKPKPPGR